MGKYFVYVLYSDAHSRYYVGQTNNLELRLQRHNSGQVVSTKPFRPWRFIYTAECENRAAAMKREKWLKSGAGLKFRKSLGEDIASRETGRP